VVYLSEYNIWSVLQEKVYRSKIADIDKLKTRLIDNLVSKVWPVSVFVGVFYDIIYCCCVH